MKFEVKVPEVLKGAKIEFSNPIPILSHPNENIGWVEIKKSGDEIEGEVSVQEESYKKVLKFFDVELSGKILSRDGDLIKDFVINSVSLKVKI